MTRSSRNVNRFYTTGGNTRTGVKMGLFDYFSKKDKDVMCPECEKHKRHVKLVETDGKAMECPECHYAHLARR